MTLPPPLPTSDVSDAAASDREDISDAEDISDTDSSTSSIESVAPMGRKMLYAQYNPTPITLSTTTTTTTKEEEDEKEKVWRNKQRVLVLSTRGITERYTSSTTT